MNISAMDLHARFERRRKGLYVVLAIGAVASFCALFAAATNLGGMIEAWRTIREVSNPTPEQLRQSAFGWSRWTLIECLFAVFGVASVVVSLLRLNRLAKDERAFAAESEGVAPTASA